MSPSRLFFIVLMLSPASASAGEVALRLCADINPRPPYMMPDGSGIADRRVAIAAREAGLIPQVFPVSLARCAAEVKAGLMHSFPMVPYKPEIFPFIVYPMRAGAVDVRRATLTARQMLFRPKGGSAGWDGTRITGVRRAVLVNAGSLPMIATLKSMNVPSDAHGKSLQVNLAKMLAGRGEAAIGFEGEGAALLTQAPFRDKVEMLPVPMQEVAFYLGVSRSFYDANRDAVEKMWDAVGRLNQAAKAQKK